MSLFPREHCSVLVLFESIVLCIWEAVLSLWGFWDSSD